MAPTTISFLNILIISFFIVNIYVLNVLNEEIKNLRKEQDTNIKGFNNRDSLTSQKMENSGFLLIRNDVRSLVENLRQELSLNLTRQIDEISALLQIQSEKILGNLQNLNFDSQFSQIKTIIQTQKEENLNLTKIISSIYQYSFQIVFVALNNTNTLISKSNQIVRKDISIRQRVLNDIIDEILIVSNKLNKIQTNVQSSDYKSENYDPTFRYIEDAFSKKTMDTFQIGQQQVLFFKEAISDLAYDMRLIYRASIDGFHWKDFHRKVVNKGPTLTLIKSEHDKVFGVYRTIDFNLGEYSSEDQNAFIFSLSRMSVHRPYADLTSTITNANSGYVIIWLGGGFDLWISSNSNLNSESHSHLGWTYSLPDYITNGTYEAQSYLAGAFQFKVKEIEVYQLRFAK